MTDQVRDSLNAENNTSSSREKKSGKKSKIQPDSIITYGEVDEIARALVEAQPLPREKKIVQNRKEIISLLKDGIIEYLKKGYSTLATVEFINSRLPTAGITDDDVKALLPFVTKKRRSGGRKAQAKPEDKKPDENSSTMRAINNHPLKNTGAAIDKIRGHLQLITLNEKLYLEVPFTEKDEVKELGAQYEPDIKKWHVKSGDDIRKFLKWLSSEDFKRLTGYDKPLN
jgi:hypothetical protein